MRISRIALLLLVSAASHGQAFKLHFPPAGQAASPPAGGIRHGHPVRAIPRVWGWGGGWWGDPGPVRVIVEKAPEPEKPAPRYVFNKEYVPERHSPRMTEVAASPAAPREAEWRKCSLRLTSGESFDKAACAEVDDSVLVKAESGRRYRFSSDLIASLRSDP